MNRDLLADWADNLVAERPETSDLVSNNPTYYAGRGNLCWRLSDYLGLTREARLQLAAQVFELPALGSFKELTIAQLESLWVFREQLGESHV